MIRVYRRQEVQRKIQPILARYQEKLARLIRRGEATEAELIALFEELRAALGPEIAAITMEQAVALMEETGIVLDVAMVSEEAIRWARDYSYELVRGLDATTRKLLQEAVSTYASTPGMTIGDLDRILEPAFGPVRAEMIATTEVTRAYAEATNEHQRMVERETGIRMRRVWETLNDDLVCPICGPLNGKPEEDWAVMFPGGPPAHPRCRCSTSLELVE